MGCRFSCCRSASIFEGVRVVHINGYVEDFPGPVTVGEVTGKPPGLVCFSPAQLLSFTARPLGLEEQLEPGKIYFLLPHTVLQSDSSPVDLAALATRLSALARSGRRAKAASAFGSCSLPVPRGNDFHSPPSHHADAGSSWKPQFEDRYAHPTDGSYGREFSSKMRSWKPILDTIEESFRKTTTEDRSFGRSTTGLSGRSSNAYSRIPTEEQ